MIDEREKRALLQAVSRYGVDPARAQAAVQAVIDAETGADPARMVATLRQGQFLSPQQARDILVTLDRTSIDLRATATPNPHAKKPEIPRQLGDYRLLRKLGEGGMGTVFLAFQESQHRHVAIKVLGALMSNHQPAIDRFYREAKSGALLNHPNIVRNLAVGQDRATELHYLVMDYVDGPGADALLEKHGRFSVGDAVRIVLDIARGLEHIHSRNIVHRDVKPANILLSSQGVAKLTDLGLAKRLDEASHLTGTHQGFGTPYYMPYEQAINARRANHRSDIYALGATFYHFLVGKVPIDGDNHLDVVERKKDGSYLLASSQQPDVPKVLDQILAKMLAAEPLDRFPAVRDVIAALDKTGLASSRLSFPELDHGEDPLVRQRPASIFETTAVDASIHGETPAEGMTAAPWFLRFKDRHGDWTKARATTDQLLDRIQKHKLPAEIELATHPQGEFRPIAEYPEFQKVLGPPRASAEKKKRKSKRRTAWWMWAVVAGAAMASLIWFVATR